MGRFKNDKRQLMLRSTLSSGLLMETHRRCREERPEERFVIVICDLSDSWGLAMATWDGSSTEQQRRGYEIWVYAYSLSAWQENRRKLSGSGDHFEHEGEWNAIHYAIVSGPRPLTGTLVLNHRRA